MERIVRIPHFSRDGKPPKSIELLLVRPATNTKGYIDEGRLVLMVDDGGNRVGFQLTIAEASLLYQRLGYALETLAEDFHKMSKDRKPSTSSPRKTEREADSEQDEYNDDYTDMDQI